MNQFEFIPDVLVTLHVHLVKAFEFVRTQTRYVLRHLSGNVIGKNRFEKHFLEKQINTIKKKYSKSKNLLPFLSLEHDSRFDRLSRLIERSPVNASHGEVIEDADKVDGKEKYKIGGHLQTKNKINYNNNHNHNHNNSKRT